MPRQLVLADSRTLSSLVTGAAASPVASGSDTAWDKARLAPWRRVMAAAVRLSIIRWSEEKLRSGIVF